MRILRRDRKAEVTLLDHSSASLEFSRHRLGRYGERASFVCGSAEALPFPPSSFSTAVMSDALYYVDMEKAFAVRKEIKKALDGLYDGILIDLEERNGSD